MKNPVQIHIPIAYQQDTKYKTRAPANVSYPLDFARCNYWKHPQFSLVEQYYDGKDVFICLDEVITQVPLDIPITCAMNDLYWLYNLNNTFRLSESNVNQDIFTIDKDHYSLIDLPKGNYTAHFEPGRYLLYYFVVKKSWLNRSESTGLEALENYLKDQKSLTGRMKAPILNYFTIGAQSRTLLLLLFGMEQRLSIEQDVAVYQKTVELLIESLKDIGSCKPQDTSASQSKLLVDEVRSYIAAQIKQGTLPSINTIAEHFCVDRSYLWKWHQYYYRNSLKEYINRYTFSFAHELVLHSNMSISEIAFKIGYAEVSSFSKAFKHQFGYSPSNLRHAKDLRL